MTRTNIVIIISSVSTLIFVLELVRRRKLREEYSWLWLLTSVVYLVVTLWSGLGNWITGVIGTNSVPIAFAFIGLQFIAIISIQYSVRLSNLTNQIKDLTQEIAILEGEIRQLQKESEPQSSTGTSQLVEKAELSTREFIILERKLDEVSNLSNDET
jgi:hypothetical protein